MQIEKFDPNSWKHVIIITRSRPQIKTFKWHIFAAFVSITQLTIAAQLFVALGVHIITQKLNFHTFVTRIGNSQAAGESESFQVNNVNYIRINDCNAQTSSPTTWG